MSLWTEAHRCVSETRLDKDEYTGPLRNNKTVDPEEAEEEESKTEKEGDSTSESEESDEEMTWYSPKMDSETYFVFVNNNRADFEKGN